MKLHVKRFNFKHSDKRIDIFYQLSTWFIGFAWGSDIDAEYLTISLLCFGVIFYR